MKQFFSKLFKSSQPEVKNQIKLNFMGLPENEFISDPDEIENSVITLIDEMLEFNQERREAISNKIQMLDIDFRKKWEYPKMAKILLSNCIFLPQDFPVVLKYLGLIASTSPFKPTKFYKLKNYYIVQNTPLYDDLQSVERNVPYIVYTNGNIYVMFSIPCYKLIISDQDGFKYYFCLRKDFFDPVEEITESMKSPFIPFYYNKDWTDLLGLLNIIADITSQKKSLKEKEIEYSFTIDIHDIQNRFYHTITGCVHITSKKFSYKLRRYALNGNVGCSNDEMTPAEFTVCVKKIHQDFLKNLDKLHSRFQDVRHSLPDHQFYPKAFINDQLCKISLPFEILYQNTLIREK